MKKVNIITIGKNKSEGLLSEEQNFIKRIKSFTLNIVELKQSDSKDQNDTQIIKKIESISDRFPNEVVLLEETGDQMLSTEFSTFSFNLLEEVDKQITFIIGGADGHADIYARRPIIP